MAARFYLFFLKKCIIHYFKISNVFDWCFTYTRQKYKRRDREYFF